MSLTVRLYQPHDLEAVQRLARDTAWFGQPMEQGYGQHHDLVHLLRVDAYLDHSPDLAFVAEENGEVIGYWLGVAHSHTHHDWLKANLPKRLVSLAPQLAWADWQLLLRQALNGGGGAVDDRLLALFPAHLHINLGEKARGRGVGRALMARGLAALRERGVTGVHLGTSDRNTGADAFFRATGFSLVDQRPYRLWPGLGGGECRLLIYAQPLGEGQPRLTGLPPAPQWGERRAKGVRHHDFAVLVPGPGLPPGAPVQQSVNNCDVVRHNGWYYLAYRTAKTHFASGGATLVILKSRDFAHWQTVAAHRREGFDFREPRFLSWNGKLFFYYFASKDNPTDFDPAGSFVVDLSQDQWPDTPLSLLAPGWVPWRARAWRGKVLLSTYWGKKFHHTQAQNTRVQLFESTDGLCFSPLSQDAQLALPGACETDFAVMDDGALVGAVRNELTGGHLFESEGADITRWRRVDVNRRLDSPLVFRHGQRVFLICRRHPGTPLGEAAPDQLPGALGVGLRWARYSLTPKRTALYEIHRNPLRLEHLFDLPGKGDTAFAAVAQRDQNSLWLVNYTSVLDGPDLPWIGGQLGTTVLTRAVLGFE